MRIGVYLPSLAFYIHAVCYHETIHPQEASIRRPTCWIYSTKWQGRAGPLVGSPQTFTGPFLSARSTRPTRSVVDISHSSGSTGSANQADKRKIKEKEPGTTAGQGKGKEKELSTPVGQVDVTSEAEEPLEEVFGGPEKRELWRPLGCRCPTPQVLSSNLDRRIREGLIHSCKLGRDELPLSHLLYADDVLVFTNGATRSLRMLMLLLQNYERSSGQLTNLRKSAFYVGKRARNRVD